VRTRDGSPGLESAAREDAALTWLADGRPPEHRLVRRLRGNAGRSAEPDRLRGAAAPAGKRRKGEGTGRGSGAAQIGGARAGAARFRPDARRGARHRRALDATLVEAGAARLGPDATDPRGD